MPELQEAGTASRATAGRRRDSLQRSGAGQGFAILTWKIIFHRRGTTSNLPRYSVCVRSESPLCGQCSGKSDGRTIFSRERAKAAMPPRRSSRGCAALLCQIGTHLISENLFHLRKHKITLFRITERL